MDGVGEGGGIGGGGWMVGGGGNREIFDKFTRYLRDISVKFHGIFREISGCPKMRK